MKAHRIHSPCALKRLFLFAGVMHWQSPNFYAYFPSAFSFPSLLGDLMSSALSVNGFLWVSSPAATELETVNTLRTFPKFGLTCLR